MSDDKRRFVESDDDRALKHRSFDDDERTPVEAIVHAIRMGKPDEVTKVLEKLHARLTTVELRIGASLGVGDDDGKLGKLRDRVANLWKAAVFAIGLAVSSTGAVAAVVWSRGDNNGETRTRIEQLERQVNDLTQAFWSFRLQGVKQP